MKGCGSCTAQQKASISNWEAATSTLNFCFLVFHSTYFPANSMYSVVPGGHCFEVPEDCRSVLPYNTTNGIALNATHSANFTSWDTIEPFVQDDTKSTFCGLLYPQCSPLPGSQEMTYVNCREKCCKLLCQTTFFLMTMGYQKLTCEQLPEVAPGNSTCLNQDKEHTRLRSHCLCSAR